MTEEEYFRKTYPDSCYGDRPLSPHWDFFQDGVEFGERESEEKIKDLTEQNTSLLTSVENLNKSVQELEVQLEREKNLNQCLSDNNEQLKAQIEKMKCCGNCKNGELSAHEEPCPHCQRCFVSADVTDQENVSDKWELAND